MTPEALPLHTLSGTDWHSSTHMYQLESHLGASYTVTANSVQTAIQMCLELLGTRTEIVPVILPVTAPPDTVSAALRAGGHPLLLDIDEATLQMDPVQLDEALKAVDTAIVVLNRPAGAPVEDRLLSLVQEQPTIVDTRLVPNKDLGMDDLCGTFNVFDLSPIAGTGSVILHKFEKQVKQLRVVRSGIMGHSGTIPELVAAHALSELNDSWDQYVTTYREAVEEYTDDLADLKEHGIIPQGQGRWPTPFYVRVPNARKMVAHLSSYGIEANVGLYPLYKLPEIRRRYKEDPEYPIVDSLENSIVCLPTHKLAKPKIKQIVSYMKEVT